MAAGTPTGQLLASYARFHEAGAVLRSRSTGRILVVGAQAAQDLLNHPHVGAVEPEPAMSALADRLPPPLRPKLADIAGTARLIMTQRQDPDHARCRRAFTRLFNAAAVNSRSPAICAHVEKVLGSLEPARQTDFMTAVAFPVADAVAADFIGIPAPEYRPVHRITQRIAEVAYAVMEEEPTARVEDGYAALGEFRSRLAGWLSGPLPPGSVLAEWAADRIPGVDRAEFEANVLMLVQAGLETTAGTMGNAVAWLLGNDAVRRELIDDPGRIGAFVEEVLRIEPPLILLERQVRQDFEYDGKRFAAPEVFTILIGAANHDPCRFPAPGTLNPDREQASSFAFGGGGYRCLGFGLAIRETELLVSELLRRFPRAALAEPEISWVRHIRFRMPASLPVIPQPAETEDRAQ
jgi:cytochrome P450